MENTSQKGFNQLTEVGPEIEINEHECFACGDKGCDICNPNNFPELKFINGEFAK